MDLNEYVTAVPDFPIDGVSFKDITPMLSHPEAFAYSVDQLTESARGMDAGSIAAFDARGFLWAAPMAYALRLPLVPIRKAGKLPRATAAETYQGEYGAETVELHTDAVGAGDRVLLVDDVIATGESMRAGARLVEGLGGTVVGCAAVIELTYLGAQQKLDGLPVVSLLRY
ncbi:MAG TPA: adenine phosphoribosyltransferase [Stackebrandtia sp.]|jgi:adenine phosphoribosyltransferase|uniref:adenine phosphoribosyltransferase n=1 Tax=Stackebrandtia sp. TaxID=2023065 RepID=UPI002D3FD42B|nr:adenine phosphoribosyltransferase [Stackebrandtia sp.]HZE37751.1 adenine phosphoribosyltransferase [Stackebrandtia sp.]